MTKISVRQIKKALDTLPQELDSAYNGVMGRIDAQSAEYANLAKQVLCWLLYAARPLTAKELQHALAVEVGDTSFDEDGMPDEGLLVSVCAGMVVHRQDDGLIGLVHYTAKEFLEREGAKIFPTAHDEISATCLAYLSLNEFRYPSSIVESEDYDYYYHLFFIRYPFLNYATLYWGYHVQKSRDDETQMMGFNFLQHKNTWVHITLHPSLWGLRWSVPIEVSALQVAAVYGLDRISEILISKGFDVNEHDTDGRSALIIAIGEGRIRVVQILLAKGADIESRNERGETALHHAMINCHLDIMRFLLENGANIEALSIGHQTLIMVASMYNNKDGIRLLLEKGADINATDWQGRTVLHKATIANKTSLVKLLLENNADLWVYDCDNRTPMDYAVEAVNRGAINLPIIEMLQERTRDNPIKDKSSGGPPAPPPQV